MSLTLHIVEKILEVWSHKHAETQNVYKRSMNDAIARHDVSRKFKNPIISGENPRSIRMRS